MSEQEKVILHPAAGFFFGEKKAEPVTNVSRLRHRVQTGKYKVDPRLVAEKIIQEQRPFRRG